MSPNEARSPQPVASTPSAEDESERLRRQLALAERRLMTLEAEHAALRDHLERGLPERVRKRFEWVGKNPHKTFLEHRRATLDAAAPSKWHEKWDASCAPRTFLMICHDQGIDRRIMQQIHTLQADGWKGVLVCLSHDKVDALEEIDGLLLHRVGLAHIVPDCPHFWRYQDSLRVVDWWGRAARFLRHQSYLRYWKRLEDTYINTNICYPLPFDEMFYAAGLHYPASVVVGHDLPALGAASRLARTWQVPLVYDAHELYYEQKPFSDWQKRLMRDIEAELILRCDAVFTVNLSIAEEMARRYGCPTPNVLTNAIDAPADFDVEAPHRQLRSHFSLGDDAKIVLFQGGMVANRNLDLLVESFRHVRDPRAHLVMMGDGDLVEPLRKRAEGLRVHFKAAVAQADLLAWTASADLGVIPYPQIDLNTLWCTPNKLFEFIQAGLPMVANDSPELRRFVHDTGFGIVGGMENAEQIAGLIDALLGDDKRLRSTRQTVLSQRSRFSWTAESARYRQVMNALPQRRPVV